MTKKQSVKKAPAGVKKPPEPIYSKEQLMHAKTIEISKDVMTAVLQDGEQYTKDQVKDLVLNFMERKV